LRAVLQVCRLLVATYRIAHILGHEEIAPERKVDPGPAFPLDDLRARLLNGQFPQPDPVQARVRAVRAPVLARPAARAERVAGSVPRGTQLEVLAQQGSWCRVRLAAEGWTEQLAQTPLAWAQCVRGTGLGAIIYTDIARDGMLTGVNVAATAAIVAATDVPVIAAGGVASLDDVAACRRAGCAGVIVGRAYYDGRIDLGAACRLAAEEDERKS